MRSRRPGSRSPEVHIPDLEAHVSSDFDTPPGTPEPRSAYVVCATPRSGSGLLCRALIGLGQAGVPLEYFNRPYREPLAARWGVGTDLDAYARELRQRRGGPGGVLGVKLHWANFCALYGAPPPFGASDDILVRLLGVRPAYVHILRRDIDRQAVSLVIAERSGEWARLAASRPPRRGPMPYRFHTIADARLRLLLAEAHWERFFVANGITPLRVVYEDLVARYEEEVARVAAFVAPGGVGPVTPPTTVKQGDARADELLARFHRDLARREERRLRRRRAARLTAVVRRPP